MILAIVPAWTLKALKTSKAKFLVKHPLFNPTKQEKVVDVLLASHQNYT